MSSVALVSSHDPMAARLDLDTALIVDALGARGLSAQRVAWDDESVDWSAFDLVYLRSPWDYPERVDAFLAWLDGLDEHKTANHPALIRWNMTKTYLRDLAESGAPVTPTRFCTTLDDVETAVAALTSARIVMKPAVGAASRGVNLLERTSPRVRELAREAFADGQECLLVQPEVAHISAHGEYALLFFGGEFSHAFHKGPLLAPGGGLRTEGYVEQLQAHQPADDELVAAQHAMRVINQLCREREWDEPLYARVDLAPHEGRWVLVEAELFEPNYNLRFDPASLGRVCDAVVSRLGSQGA